MKQFYTVVLDRLTVFSGTLLSEPYEAGWADEAIAFVRIHDGSSITHMRVWVQISPDGIEWIDEGTSAQWDGRQTIVPVRVSNFGGWLRLCIETDGQCKVTSYFALKG